MKNVVRIIQKQIIVLFLGYAKKNDFLTDPDFRLFYP